MTMKIHADLAQGSDEWKAARCGLITASEMKLILTPSLKPASNEKERAHLWELLAQRITGYVEPQYVSDDMLRGQEDEIQARALYAEHYAPVTECGFITNDVWGFTIGYSPDGLVGDDGLIECKSRRQKYQMQTIVEWAVPDEFILQIQTGLLVSGRQWCDFVSYCGGLPMAVLRVHPDTVIHEAIVAAAAGFERRIRQYEAGYRDHIAHAELRTIPTVRRIEEAMFL